MDATRSRRDSARTRRSTRSSYPDADTTELVPLFRRTAFDRDLARGCMEATAERPVSLLMVDVDYFKKVNDTCGPRWGRQVLIGIAQMLRAVVSRKGRGYRYGGEELAAILPDFDVTEAYMTAERFRLRVENCVWTGEELGELRVTVSVGVPTVLASESADKALYLAKEAGRNRVKAGG
jgi:diguanylate cyclase